MTDQVSQRESGCWPTGVDAARADGRRIGLWGTASRGIVGAALVAWGIAVPHAHPVFDLPGAGSRPLGTLAGLVLVPAILTSVLALRGRTAPPLRLGAGPATAVTVLVVLLAQVFPVAILVFIGATLLLLAVKGVGGCEVLGVPNLVLGRRDYLACLPFTPIDQWEAARADQRGVDQSVPESIRR